MSQGNLLSVFVEDSPGPAPAGTGRTPDFGRGRPERRRSPVTATTPGHQFLPAGLPRLAVGSWRVDPARRMRLLPPGPSAGRCSGACRSRAGCSLPSRSRIPPRGWPPGRAPSAPGHLCWTGCWPGPASWTPGPSRRSASGPSCWPGSRPDGGPSAACRSRTPSMNWPARLDLHLGGTAARRLPRASVVASSWVIDSQVGNPPADPRTWPPHRDDVLIVPRTGHVSALRIAEPAPGQCDARRTRPLAWLNRPALLCVLVVESETTAAPCGTRPAGTAGPQEETNV